MRTISRDDFNVYIYPLCDHFQAYILMKLISQKGNLLGSKTYLNSLLSGIFADYNSSEFFNSVVKHKLVPVVLAVFVFTKISAS